MDLNTMRENYNKIVKYNHRGDTIFATLSGIYFYKIDEKEICSVILTDKSGATYRANPKDLEKIEENADIPTK